MREILFRGLDKRYNKAVGHEYNVWRFGSLIEHDNGQAAIVASADRYGRGMFTNEVIPETVGQYTGLDDKNGVKIFEGDIVREHGNDYTPIYQNGIYMAYNVDKINDPYVSTQFNVIWRNGCEIIGTIHDNPELLNA